MILLSEITIPETVASEEMDPIDMPWPPEHVLPVNTILEPALIARQSS